MTTIAQEQEQEQLELVEKETYLRMGEDLAWLKNCKQFQRVILKGYLQDKALASVSLLAHPGVIKHGERPSVIEDLISTSNLSYFFMMVENQYEGASNEDVDDENDYTEDGAN